MHGKICESCAANDDRVIGTVYRHDFWLCEACANDLDACEQEIADDLVVCLVEELSHQMLIGLWAAAGLATNQVARMERELDHTI
jgi:hypothetical protein